MTGEGKQVRRDKRVDCPSKSVAMDLFARSGT